MSNNMRPVLGKNKLLLIRKEDEEGNAWKPAFQTEHSFDESRSFDSDPTKDGNLLTPGDYEATPSFTMYEQVGDDKIKKFKKEVRSEDPGRFDLWEIDTSDMTGESIPGTFANVYITDVSPSSPSDGKVEYSIDAQVDGKPIDGEVNVTPALQALVAAIEEEQEFIQPTQNGEPEGA